jgi:hypothetical protein
VVRSQIILLHRVNRRFIRPDCRGDPSTLLSAPSLNEAVFVMILALGELQDPAVCAKLVLLVVRQQALPSTGCAEPDKAVPVQSLEALWCRKNHFFGLRIGDR